MKLEYEIFEFNDRSAYDEKFNYTNGEEWDNESRKSLRLPKNTRTDGKEAEKKSKSFHPGGAKKYRRDKSLAPYISPRTG